MDNNFDPNRGPDLPPSPSDEGGRFAFGDYFNSAMRSALVVGIGFVLQALAITLFQWGLISTFLYFLGLVAVPVLLYTTAKKFFGTQVTGPVPYLSAAAYLFWTFLLSLIIAALVYYMAFYIMFRNPAVMDSLAQSMEAMKSFVTDKAMLDRMTEAYSTMTPKSMTLSTCSTFFFFGTVYVYIIALFLRRS